MGRTASPADIRAAYRAQAARYHPDKHRDNPLEDLASERLAALNRAYEVLSDPARRTAYDAELLGRPGSVPNNPGLGFYRRKTLLRIGLAAFALLTLLRVGRPIARGAAAVARGLWRLILLPGIEVLAALRGTPWPGLLVLAALVTATVFLVRRGRRKGT